MKWIPAVMFGLIWIVGSVFAIGACYYQDQIVLTRDIDRWCDRAQISADVDDMLANIQRCEDGFDKHGMHDGYAGLLVKNAGNDMALIRQTIDNVQARAVQLQTIPPTERANSASYQTGLADLRDTFEQTDFQAQAYYWRHDGLLRMVLTNVWIFLGWIPMVLAGAMAVFYEDRSSSHYAYR